MDRPDAAHCKRSWKRPNNQLESELHKHLAAEEVEAIVLGYPTRSDGSDTHSTPAVRAFEQKLKEWFPGISVHRWDERYTSQMAMEAMIHSGLGRKKRRDKHLINEVSATIILQDFLQHK